MQRQSKEKNLLIRHRDSIESDIGKLYDTY
jgi:hypothetical protein